MRRILCLHMPYLPTERARRDGGWAGERDRPVVLTRRAGASTVVEQVCPLARARALRPGLTLGQAQALAPGLMVLEDAPQRDREVLHGLARWALRLGPTAEPVAPGTLLVDVTGCARLFGGEENIAEQGRAGLTAQGFAARAAIADTVGAAWAVAVQGLEPVRVVPPGHASAALAPLPPEALRIDPRIRDRLEALGIRSIGDLLMLPRATLPARFGPELVRRLQQALGELPEPLMPLEPDDRPTAARGFEVPLTDLVAVRAVAGELLDILYAELCGRGLALRRLQCVLYHERTPPRVLELSLARPTRAREHVAGLLEERLSPGNGGRIWAEDGDLDAEPNGVTGVRLTADETVRWQPEQEALFDGLAPHDGEALAMLLDRLAGRLGHAALVRPRLVDDHQPEMAFRYVTVADAGCTPDDDPAADRPPSISATDDRRPQAGAPGAPTSPSRQPRPLKLLPRPVPIRVLALVPDGPPTWLLHDGQEHVVRNARGPERIETAWWRGADVRRDYFHITVESGAQFWVFRDARRREWYLHGVFA